MKKLTIEEVVELLFEKDKISEPLGYKRKRWGKKNEFYLLRTSEKNIVLKHSLKGYGADEFHAMDILYNEGFPVPRPIHFIGEYEIIEGEDWAYGDVPRKVGWLAYEYVEGKTLDNSMKEELLFDAMKLLKYLHDYPKHKKEEPFIPNFQQVEIDRIEFYLGRLKTRGDLNDEEFEKIRNFVEPYKTMEIDYRIIHGDYRPNNLIVADPLIMIDFEGFSEGADPRKDVGTFLAETKWAYDIRKIQIDLEKIYRIYFPKPNRDDIRIVQDFMIKRFLVKMTYNSAHIKIGKEKVMSIVTHPGQLII